MTDHNKTSTAYHQMKLSDLRRLATEQRGRCSLWSGTELMDAPKEDIVTFLETGIIPSLSHKEIDRGVIRLNRRSFTMEEITNLAVKLGIVTENKSPHFRNNKNESGGRIGRPSKELPSDIEPLLKRTAAHSNGQASKAYTLAKMSFRKNGMTLAVTVLNLLF
jgi:hypothetical protein